jgi:hypothetical protein
MPYDYTSWKSENALSAEDHGLLKAGQLAKRLGLTTAAVRKCIPPAEWHHVGGGYAKVDYYHPEPAEWKVARAREYDRAATPQTYLGCDVRWLDWPAFKVGRFATNSKARPREVRHERVAVSRVSANSLVIRLPDGVQVTKRATTKGLRVVRGGEVILEA